ncbi:MAG: hypothetical protein LBP59_10285 [Planctomycetaceae bacterium]|jgi:hypothetical protein|nr:hypothetical protein [Planctomycetaceae bacterium]
MKKGNTEYAYWTNSHGKRYNKSTFGEPFDGCWFDGKLLEAFLKTSFNYGKPYVVLPESVWRESKGITYDWAIPFPEGF